jgi:non-specific protein-tyrosine kinase
MSKLKKALQRAKESREDLSSYQQPININRHELRAQNKKEVTKSERKVREKISVTYSKTRIEKVDRELLRKNKIFSAFKDNKTTDQVDGLRTQLLSKLDELNGNSILVTSAHPGEGKTFTAINLGVSIAQQLDRTVLIIDVDLRNPWRNHFDFAYDFWGLKPEKGLADFLLGDAEIEDVILNPGIEKLTIIPAGKSLPNSTELLSSQRMEKFIDDVKNRYGANRICIFDTPALLPYTDAMVISHLIDGILLVVEAERTIPEDLKKAVKLLQGKPLLGTVFNKSRNSFEPDMTIKKTIGAMLNQFFDNFRK